MKALATIAAVYVISVGVTFVFGLGFPVMILTMPSRYVVTKPMRILRPSIFDVVLDFDVGNVVLVILSALLNVATANHRRANVSGAGWAYRSGRRSSVFRSISRTSCAACNRCPHDGWRRHDASGGSVSSGVRRRYEAARCQWHAAGACSDLHPSCVTAQVNATSG